MSWRCPDCGKQNSESARECACGYSFAKILGIKPDASLKEAQQAFRYAQSVWQSDRFSHDPIAQKKAQERMKKIEAAFVIFKQSLSSSTSGGSSKIVKHAAIAGITVCLFLGFLLYFFQSRGEKTLSPRPLYEPGVSSKQTVDELRGGVGPEPLTGLPRETHPSATNPSLPASDLTPEDAIELVKRSQALYPNTMTDAIIRKWTDENSSKFVLIGWTAKKMSDQKYFVSYTGQDGGTTKGFFFEVDPQTGTVVNIAGDPALKNKYSSELPH